VHEDVHPLFCPNLKEIVPGITLLFGLVRFVLFTSKGNELFADRGMNGQGRLEKGDIKKRERERGEDQTA